MKKRIPLWKCCLAIGLLVISPVLAGEPPRVELDRLGELAKGGDSGKLTSRIQELLKLYPDSETLTGLKNALERSGKWSMKDETDSPTVAELEEMEAAVETGDAAQINTKLQALLSKYPGNEMLVGLRNKLVKSSDGQAGDVNSGRKGGDRITLKLPGGETITFQYCPPGNFTMGSPMSEKERRADEDQVPVRITRGFWLARTETTQAQWRAVMGNNPSKYKGDNGSVDSVSWNDAQAFIGKVNEGGGLPAGWKWALPTEAQWEYACRAGTTTAYSFGSFENLSNAYKRDELKGPNPWGLEDMHVNQREWCADLYGEALAGGADPVGPSSGLGNRVLRGGIGVGRAAYREKRSSGHRSSFNGFRLALVPSK